MPSGPRVAQVVCTKRANALPDAALAADVGHLDPVGAGGWRGAQLGVAVAASPPDAGQRRAELVVVGALAQQRPQVVPGAGEQAGVELAVGRQPRTGAVAAKRLGDRGDHTDLPLPVAVAIAVGDLAP